MEAVTNVRADCRGMYSWWWDSHISPKNSQWLRENLGDMDVKVKQMIGIIEEDADSFAKRAEMYYKKRPELRKLAEDFYRAYQALAERYDHATGLLRHARRTMAEAFPNKVKMMLENGHHSVKYGDDSDDFPTEWSSHEITAVIGLPEEFISVENKSGFDELDGLFNSLGAEKKSCFHSCGCDEGFLRAMASAEGTEKEVTAEKAKQSETEQVQEKSGRLEERDNEADLEIEHEKETIKEGGVARESDLSEQQKSRERFDVEDSLQKLKDIWFQFQEGTISLFVQLQGKVLLQDDAESCLLFLQEEIHKVQEENSVLSERERLRMLEADSNQLACVIEQVRLAGVDPENLVPSIKELYDKLTKTKKTLEDVRSENTALREKSVLFDECIKKNVLLEVDIFYLEMQLEEFRDKVQFLEESCESLLEERSNATCERDSLASRLQETADQNDKLREMNRRLETSLSEANSQLRALMMRAKGIKDYLQNTEKDYDELRSQYSVLEAEKEALMSEITRLQIELKTKEECIEELEKSLDANINDLFPNRDACDVDERNSSLLFKFQTLAEAWKFSQVQISCLEHENLVQQSELQFLSDQIDIGKASLRAMSKSKVSPEESVESGRDGTKNMIQKVHDWHESLSNIEEEYLESAFEKFVLYSSLVQMQQEAAEVLSNLNISKIENLRLKNENAEVKSDNDVLLCELLCGKDLLCEKENRILETEKLLKAVHGEEKKVQRKLYNLKMELANAKLAKEDQEKQISRLSEDLNLRIVESGCLQEEIRRMECQLLDVNEDYYKICRQEQNQVNEVRIWEARAATIFCELVTSGLKEAILEDRVIEVNEANGKENESRTLEIERLKEMVKRLEGENDELRSRADALVWEIEKVNPVSEPKDQGCGAVPADDDEEVADKMAFYKPHLEISLAQNEFTTKEIVLDQSFGYLDFADSRSLCIEADDRMLELWETSDASGNIDLKVGKPPTGNRPDDSNFEEARKDCSVDSHHGESQDDKEIGPDKQEITESYTEHKQVGSKRRLLERLNTDAQKLMNLHITLNDLQRMAELIMPSGLESGGEYDTIKAQLDEARATTARLSQANTKLVKAVEKRFHSRPVKPTSEAPDDGESFIRRRISEKARRGSEKVTRLQSETQKLQFLLLRLGEQEDKARAAAARVVDRKPRVLLKDYLNSRSRCSSGSHRQKKVQFCACVQLPSRRSREITKSNRNVENELISDTSEQ